MSKVNVIRAWKDSEYCNSLSATERNSLPANPAGRAISKSETVDIVPTIRCHDTTTTMTSAASGECLA